VERLPVGFSLLVDFSSNELNQNKLLKPPLRPQIRCASLPSESSVRLGHNFFIETKARLLAMPIFLAFLITNMTHLAVR
jgi:hypothetical protein